MVDTTFKTVQAKRIKKA